MADFTDRIRLIVDTVTEGASGGLKGLKGDVADAEGAFGKLKAGASGAATLITENIGLAGTAAAGAVAAFVAKSVGHFEELAEKSANVATQMGTDSETASRWVQVADDLGVSVDSIAGASQRLNREGASGVLAKYGINAGDSNARLLDTLQYLADIPNAADRAKAQFEIFRSGRRRVDAADRPGR